MKFDLVKFTDLNRESFKQASTWAQYYEPEDIETLSRIGYERDDVTEALERVGWSDEYWFAIPDEAPVGSFMFEYRKAYFKTQTGKKLMGYVVNSGHCICLFGSKKEWHININLLEILNEQINELKVDIGLNKKECLLPLEVEVLTNKMRFIFG